MTYSFSCNLQIIDGKQTGETEQTVVIQTRREARMLLTKLRALFIQQTFTDGDGI